ncbi:S1 family peptidase [Rhizohabitans arisaemae]|uniref:S1 family peptidase n=1 Tax=Rhizohabitans arisaemae TaxID=2720610 RepID=UPI0024B22640|nr:S1 family peptidase [Rhizohabitans arisaemae]
MITVDPFENPVTLPYLMDFVLGRAETRALAKPDVYAVPYVVNGQLFSPVVDPAEQAAASSLVVPRLLPTQPDDGTDDETAMPPPDETEKPADPPPAAAEVAVPERKLAPQASGSLAAEGETTSMDIQVPIVKYSWNRLEAIKDEVLGLTPDVLPGVDHLINAMVQPERNRVVVEANAAPDALRTALATRYGSDAVAILLTDAVRPSPLARHNDGSPFYGGSKIRTNVTSGCTSAFPWQVQGVAHMVTAGHCTSGNGWANTPVTEMGTVIKDNWNNGKGTVKIDGQTAYRGDVSLIKVKSGKTVQPRIYVGNATSGSSRIVGGMWSRKARHGDKFCSGGQVTGELCGWMVYTAGMTVHYGDGTILRNAFFAKKRGTCPRGGDSGGPAYTVNARGRIVAKGVFSGGGGSGTAANPCRGYFTDIWDAYAALPGSPKVGS